MYTSNKKNFLTLSVVLFKSLNIELEQATQSYKNYLQFQAQQCPTTILPLLFFYGPALSSCTAVPLVNSFTSLWITLCTLCINRFYQLKNQQTVQNSGPQHLRVFKPNLWIFKKKIEWTSTWLQNEEHRKTGFTAYCTAHCTFWL